MTIIQDKPPIAIGGIGGSGTRLIAHILQNLGVYLGSDLNEAHDNLSFTLLFKRQELWPIEAYPNEIQLAWQILFQTLRKEALTKTTEIELIQTLCENDRPQHSADWLQQRGAFILSQNTSPPAPNVYYGWKEPNTHIFVPALLKLVPNLKYIHVMRHGMDMAYSNNQNQLLFWGKYLLKEKSLPPSPENSFRYWCQAHRRVLRHGEKMGSNFLLLNFDKLCQNPKDETPKLLDFLGLNEQQNLQKILPEIKPPSSIGRYKNQKPIDANQDDLAFLNSLGYVV